MKKCALFTAFILSLLFGHANAGWVPIASPDNRTVYADLATISRHGNVVTIWVLIDHQTIQREAGDSYLSSKGQWQIDCDAIAARQIFHVIYPGHMGSGDTIWSGSLNQDYQPIVPGSIGESILLAACR